MTNDEVQYYALLEFAQLQSKMDILYVMYVEFVMKYYIFYQ